MSFWNKLGGAVGGLIGSIPGLEGVGSGMQSYFGTSQAEDQLRDEQNYNAAEAEKNRQFQREERIAAQEYNSPAAQLERLKQAGINPNALFGSGTNPNVATNPQGGATAAGTPSIASGMLLQDAQIANLMASARKSESDVEVNEYGISWNKLTERERYDNLVNMNKESKERINKLISDKIIQEETFAWFAKQSEQDLKIKFEQVNLLRNQSFEILQNINESNARVGYIEEQTEGQNIANDIAAIEKAFATRMGVPLNTPMEKQLFDLWKQGKMQDLYDAVVFSHSHDNTILGVRAQNEIRELMNAYNDQRDAIEKANANTVTPPPTYYNPITGKENLLISEKEYMHKLYEGYRNAKTDKERYQYRKAFNRAFGGDKWPKSLQ